MSDTKEDSKDSNGNNINEDTEQNVIEQDNEKNNNNTIDQPTSVDKPTTHQSNDTSSDIHSQNSANEDHSSKRKRDDDGSDNEEKNKKTKSDESVDNGHGNAEDSGKSAADQTETGNTSIDTNPAVVAPAHPAVTTATTVPTATDVPTVDTASGNGQGMVVLEIPPDKVGQVIGSKGLIIQEIQNRSGARTYVNQDFPPGVNRQISISGTPSAVKHASDLIKMILEQGPTSIHVNTLAGGPTTTRVIECTQADVGKIIGSGGTKIKELQSKSGARIQIDQDFPPGVPRKINITGTTPAVAAAAELVQNLLLTPDTGGHPYGPGGAGIGAGNVGTMTFGSGGQATQIIEVPKDIVGKIIGRGGENILAMQKKSGAKMNVDQNVPVGAPNKVIINGTPQAIQHAVQLLGEVVPMGAGGMMGGMMMGGYGPMGVMMQPQMSIYGMPQQPMVMGANQPQFGGYGGYPPQQTGQMMPQQAAGMGTYGGIQQTGSAVPYGASAAQYNMYGVAQQQVRAPAQQPPGGMQGTPSVWTEHKTDDGITYWYNAQTGVSQWERPTM